MKLYHYFLIAAAAPALVAADAPRLTEGYRSGVCMAGVAMAGVELQVTRRLRDGNVGVTVDMPSWPEARGQDNDANHPLSVTLIGKDGTATRFVARSGGYDTGGFSEGFWGGFGAGNASDTFYAALEKATTIGLEMDRRSFGPYPAPSWRSLENCARQNR